jgi:hypothetical protein
MCIEIEYLGARDRYHLEESMAMKFAEDGTANDPVALAKWAKWIDSYFVDAQCAPLLIRSRGIPAGHIVVLLGRRPVWQDGTTRVEANFVEDLYILPTFRRKGIASCAVELLFRKYPGRLAATAWPGGMGVDFWHYMAIESPGIRGHEYAPDEHKGYPGQYVWDMEPSRHG